MKKNTRILIIFCSLLLVFCLFIYLLLRPSAEAKAMSELEVCSTVDDVKNCWEQRRFQLFSGMERSDILSSEYLQSVRSKLNSMHLKQKEIDAINSWLPANENLNLIVVPDLSRRIKDENNNPDQVKFDTAILHQIWESFKRATYLKMNSKDRLVIDVSDRSQAQGNFRTVADNLIFDLSSHKNKSNRLYFPDKDQQFLSNINQLYSIALKNTSGADYVYYFSDVLPNRIKQNTIEDKYRNVLIILTDGYLEASKDNKQVEIFTPSAEELSEMTNGIIKPIKLPVKTMSRDFSNLEVYMFEVNERKNGIGKHLFGLKKWWATWFENMKIKNASEADFFNQHEDGVMTTKDKIDKCINL